MAKIEEEVVFAIINNIPHSYHSSDLRRFFSQLIESCGFECFHFKHRPEAQQIKEAEVALSNLDDSKTQSEGVDKNTNPKLKSETTNDSKNRSTCCVIKLKSLDKYNVFHKMYHKRHWLNRTDDWLTSVCFVQKIKIKEDSHQSNRYLTKKEKKQIPNGRETFTCNDLEKLAELHPPVNVMPNGNVGTPTKVFLTLIQECKLPPSIIKKLGLSFPRTRSNRRYGNVPFEYEHNVANQIPAKKSTIDATRSETQYKSQGECSGSHKEERQSDQSESEEDNDDCEEWERHEALQDDPTDIERNKERLFEEEIELKWEKGGSGLVFYTDAQYWKAQEGDFDEQTTDDWDVDMSVYYEENGGDKDARDYVTMRQEQRRRNGEEDTDMRTAGFMKPKKKQKTKFVVESIIGNKLGRFERFTKGIGRKVLEKQGWKEGQGLGSTIRGIADALDNEGQVPSDKRGIGYYGEKLDRGVAEGPPNFKIRKVNKEPKPVIISTIYDNPEVSDPKEELLRRNHHHHIKYRSGINFKKPIDSNCGTLT